MTKIRWMWLGLLMCVAWCATTGAGEDRYTAFLGMTPEKQTAYAKNKAKKNGLYFSCKMGRFNVFSELSAADACRWALMLDNYSDELLENTIVPKKKLNPGDPQVYVLKTKNGYARALSDFTGEPVNPGWSGGMFTYAVTKSSAKAGLFAFYEQFREEGSPMTNDLTEKDYAGMTEVLLHEGTHQMLFYHLGTAVPVWFNEGMATNFETFNCDMSLKANLYNAMYINNRADAAVMFLNEKKLQTFQAVFSISSGRWHAASSSEAQVNYATAWAACNYIFTRREGRNFVEKFMSAVAKQNMKRADEAGLGSVFSSSEMEKNDAGMREHIEKVLFPACKYGRAIRKVLNEGDKEKAAKGIEMMKAEFPDSNELKFYQMWLDILNEKDPAGVVKALTDLRKSTDFNHPEVNYVIALGLFKTGNKLAARTAIDDAVKSNAAHEPTLTLKGQILQMK